MTRRLAIRNRLSYLATRCALASACVLGVASTACGEDWPQFRGPHRDGKSAETKLWKGLEEKGPKLDWTAEGLGQGYASVAVVGGRIYTSGNTGQGQALVALDAADGKVIWKQTVTGQDPKHGYEGSRTTPTIDGDHLYAVTSDGEIICLKTADGSKVWSRPFSEWGGKMMSGWGFSESPLVDGDVVVCTPGGRKGVVVALNKKTGETKWECTLPDYGDEKGVNGAPLHDGAGYSSIVVSNGGGVKQYVQLVGRGVIGVRAADGQLLWRNSYVANGTANIPSVIADGDYVFCSTGYETGSNLLKLVPAGQGKVEAEEVYALKSREMQNKHGGMVLVDGYIYCGHGNGNGLPICVKMSDGKNAWGPERAKGNGEASVAYADGHVIFRRDDGTVLIVAANPKKFELKASFMPAFQQGKSWAHPVVAGGKLYLREQDKLMCYDIH